ncbi:hypothetical protein DERF_000090 [Dermatophagoides farinae]|uniref:Uncharacterized protein n=1 Tax=Dermatophagoides farinae TaxID=6954 RepID=A0A922L8B3_DERFA|nr:hypothetical protein DERF_000090 [Dermatophagoides farinae]
MLMLTQNMLFILASKTKLRKEKLSTILGHIICYDSDMMMMGNYKKENENVLFVDFLDPNTMF